MFSPNRAWHNRPTLTFSQSKITAAFLEYDLYAPASFVKFKGSDEVQGSICSNIVH